MANNMVYLAYDGDNAGRLVGRSVLANDVNGLHEISQRIGLGHELVKEWVEEHGGQFISGGGDEGVFALPANVLDELEQLRQDYAFATNLTMTVGIGSSLSEAGKALLSGKLRGKNCIVRYDESVAKDILAAHERVKNGTASPEDIKLDDAYINDENQDTVDPNLRYKEMGVSPPVIQKPQVGDDYNESRQDLAKPLFDTSEQSYENQKHLQGNYLGEDADQPQHPERGSDAPFQMETEGEEKKGVGGSQMIPDYAGQDISREDKESDDEAIREDKELSAEAQNDAEDPREGTVGQEEDIVAEFDATLDNHKDMMDHIDSKADPMHQEIEQTLENQKDMMDHVDVKPQEEPVHNPSDMGLSEEEDNPDLSEVLMQGLDNHAGEIQKEKIREMIGSALEGFKDHQEIFERAKDKAPELHDACIAMLKAMIEMAKMLQLDSHPEEIPEESEQAPEIHEETPEMPQEGAAPQAEQPEQDPVGQPIGKLPTKHTTAHVARVPYGVGSVNEKGQQKVIDPKTGKTRWIDRKKGVVLSSTGVPIKAPQSQNVN